MLLFAIGLATGYILQDRAHLRQRWNRILFKSPHTIASIEFQRS